MNRATEDLANGFWDYKDTGNVDLSQKEALDSLKINILGTGNFETDLPIKELEQEINGTGDGRYTQVSSCHATLNGTGDLHIQEVGDLRLKLNGTSDLIVEEIKGDLQAEVNGIGDVILRSGHIPNAKLRFVDLVICGVVASRLAISIARLLGQVP